jgi:hypothetical protein
MEFEVILYDNGERVASTEADTPEDAAFAAVTIWDEARTGLSNQNLELHAYHGGKLAGIYDRRP